MKICCEIKNDNFDTFYLINGSEKIFLFNQGRRKGVEEYYGGHGVTIDRALKLPTSLGRFSDRKRSRAIRRTMDKLPSYLRYIEKQYGIKVMKGRN